jgi:hypothetical protein
MRYYLYVSESKVDMLLAQIDPAAREKVTSELGLDLKIFTAKRTVESGGLDDKFQRVAAVSRYLEGQDDFGTVDDSGPYFGGIVSMRWGPYGDSPESPVVFFGGHTERTIVGLGGSSVNLIGAGAGQQTVFSHSATPFLLAALSRELDSPDVAATAAAGFDDDALALMAVHLAASGLEGPATSVEFVAKRLLQGPSPYPQRDPNDDLTVLLGSPIFVAMVD